MNIRENVPISNLTTMRLGGNARYVIEIQAASDIVEAYQFAKEQNLPIFVMGGGSNTIGRDEGYHGVILLNKLLGIKILSKNSKNAVIECASGEELDDLVEFTTKQGLTGVETLSAIPGTVGGAVFQNSGAYGQDLSQVIAQVSAYDSKNGKFVKFNRDELGLSYRQSIFNTSAKSRYFITAVEIKLQPGTIKGDLYRSLQEYLDQNQISDRTPATIRTAVVDIRTKKLPDVVAEASSGSFFHNVVVDDAKLADLRAKYPDIPAYPIGAQQVIPTAWLIDQAGFKGRTIHGMRSSEAAPLVLINDSAKSYSDLATARAEITHRIRDKFGLELEQEPEEI